MSNIRSLPTLKKSVDASVMEVFDRLREHIEEGDVSGIAIGVTFRDGRSWTTATRTEDRRVMLALLLDSLLDFQRNSS